MLAQTGEDFVTVHLRHHHIEQDQIRWRRTRGQIKGLLTATDQKHLELSRPGEIIRCPWHGWEFDITNGRSIFNPHRLRVRSYEVTVEPPEDDDPSLTTYPVTVERGRVVVHV